MTLATREAKRFAQTESRRGMTSPRTRGNGARCEIDDGRQGKGQGGKQGKGKGKSLPPSPPHYTPAPQLPIDEPEHPRQSREPDPAYTAAIRDAAQAIQERIEALQGQDRHVMSVILLGGSMRQAARVAGVSMYRVRKVIEGIRRGIENPL